MTARGKATILDIAREAGVSKSTVSLVLQGSGLIRPETAERVRKAIDEVGYVYNRGAANLRKAQSNFVGMGYRARRVPSYRAGRNPDRVRHAPAARKPHPCHRAGQSPWRVPCDRA